MALKKNDTLTVKIESNASITKSIAYYEGEKILIEGGHAGQSALVRIIKTRHGRNEAVIEEILSPCEGATKPACPDFNRCGGCKLQDIAYASQLKLKEEYVKNLFIKAAIPYGEFEDIVYSENTTGYRNKMEYSFGDETKGGELTLGMHKKNSHYDIVSLKNCVISPDDFNTIRIFTENYFRERNVQPYRQREKTGVLRHLVLRRSEYENAVMVNLVTAGACGFEMSDYSDKLLSLPLKGRISGILHTLNTSFADAVKADSTKIIYGSDKITEEVCGKKFVITPFSFFQTNTRSTEKLYEKALSFAGDIGEKTVFDLYCGTGTIAQIAATKASHAYGIEIVEEAVASAITNAEANGLDNCTFICGDVLEGVTELDVKPDVIILDPPRAGVSPKALEKILAFAPETFIYISCKATSLISQLPDFIKAGYEVKKVCPVDMFPFTEHVETVVLLTKTLN